MSDNINKNIDIGRLKKLYSSKKIDVDYWFDEISKGNKVILSQAITLIESTKKSDFESAQKLLQKCIAKQNSSIRIGISGVPGVGKSTFIDSFGTHLTEIGHKVAVLAVDPSSSITQGSILGDKTRMELLSTNENAYIRPSATSGALGGVAEKTREAIFLCEAAGFDVILVETVGVGQSEIQVGSMVDYFLLLMLANAGDELQGIKKGIMEIADGIVINKADGDNIQKASLAKKTYENALKIFRKHQQSHETKVMTCSALKNIGLDKIQIQISRYIQAEKQNGNFQKKRQSQQLQWFDNQLVNALRNHFFEQKKIVEAVAHKKSQIQENQITNLQAVQEIMTLYKKIHLK